MGPVCFCLVSPGGGGDSSCTTWTPKSRPPPHYVARGARPPDRFQDSAMAETRCDPVACTVFPGLLPPLSPAPPPRPSSPLLSPHPSLPSENPASWVMAWSRVREATPDRMAMTWDMETVTSASSSLWPSPRPRPVCGQCRAGVWVFFCFFSLDSSSFFKDGTLTRIALHMLGTGWKDFGVVMGGGGRHKPLNRHAVSGPVFIFKN